MSQATYIDGETVTASVFRLANPTAEPVAVELKVWIGTPIPGLEALSFFNLGADGSFVIAAGLDLELGPFPLFPVSADLPRGTYEFSSRMLDPVTGQLLSEDLNTFTIEDAPAVSSLSFQHARAIDAESLVAAIVPGSPFLEILLSQASYVNGETVTASTFRLANPEAEDEAVELKVWLGTPIPGLEALSFFNLGADGSFVIPAGFNQDFGPFPVFPVSADLPRGDYEFSSRMLHPITGDLLSEDLNPFLIQ